MKLALATATLIGAFTAQSAAAMTHCGARDDVISKLSDQYSESHIASGLQSAEGLLEIWAVEGGSWTILLTQPDGKTCVVANGTHWLEALEVEMVSGDPA
ncbi:MAG: hypothetical protein ABJF50_04335 [Paracoccaceae bacterium]